MKDVYLWVSLLAVGGFLGFLRLASSRLYSQNATTKAQRAATPPGKAYDAKTFIGRILQIDGKFVLRDNVTNDTYLLGDQGKAKPLDGRTVKLIGMLDAASRTIHVL